MPSLSGLRGERLDFKGLTRKNSPFVHICAHDSSRAQQMQELIIRRGVRTVPFKSVREEEDLG